MTDNDGLCPAKTPSPWQPGQLFCTQPAGHIGKHLATGALGNVLADWPADGYAPDAEDRIAEDRIAALPDASGVLTDPGGVAALRAWDALPECVHCDGTGKNLAGSPWENRR